MSKTKTKSKPQGVILPEEREEAKLKNLTPIERAIFETEQKKKAQAEQGRAGKAMALDFVERKKLIMTYEKHNYDRIYFTKGKGTNWIVIYDHSAVLFDKILAPRIGSKAIVYDDKDYDARSKIGYVRYPSMDMLVEKAKPFVRGVEEPQPGIYALILEKAVSKADFRMYLDEAESIVKTANSIVIPKIAYPELNAYLKGLNKRLLDIVRKLDEPVREMVGYRLYRLVSNITTEYVYATRNEKAAEQYLKNALHLVDKAYGAYMSLSWANVVESEKLREVAEGLSKVRNEIVKQLARKAFAEAKVRNGGIGK